ncbi:MAG: tRNA preQ1(34) S-adenosylmethionine ribosyltransferase-isomerase QueA [Ottowia sp.]|nr:tRNA preQ1(34) S-adenosylmethionine ribosyltransferase-isomerase QueA [Ottowia sp.]
MYSLADFDFDLPPELIAQHALTQRSASRLLEVSSGNPPQFLDRIFTALPQCLHANDLLVFNNTRVINARLLGRKTTGGEVEVLVERITDQCTALCQIRASKTPRPGSTLLLNEHLQVTIGERVGHFFTVTFPGNALALITQHGHLPLPPYITHTPEAFDEQRYQTVYAAAPGAVAAPTAGLHFDETLLQEITRTGITQRFLTLHVGAGTFTPVRTENIAAHTMHSERYHIPSDLVDAIAHTRGIGGRVIAVGTTALRALEACAARHQGTLVAGEDETNIFITPGFRFQVVDALITNYHLPKSTLFMLVCAFAGYDTMRAAYAHAIAQRYRFFSYGDAMLLTRTPYA